MNHKRPSAIEQYNSRTFCRKRKCFLVEFKSRQCREKIMISNGLQIAKSMEIYNGSNDECTQCSS